MGFKTKTMQDRVMKKVEECYAIVDKNLGLKLPYPEVRFSGRMTSTAGMFRVKGDWCELVFSSKIMVLNPEEFLAQTVPHEVAHHVVHEMYIKRGNKVPPHGKAWQKVMAVFGADDSTCHSLETPKRKVAIYEVDGEEFTLGPIQHSKLQKGKADSYYSRKSQTYILAQHFVKMGER